MIICLIGRPGSGKTTVANMLRENGFTLVEMSDGIREHMRKDGIAITSDSIGTFAGESRVKYGKDIVAKWAMPSIMNAKGDVVISGVWSAEEIAYFKANLRDSVSIVFVDSPKEERFSRIMRGSGHDRGSRENPADRATFERKEAEQRDRGIEKAILESDFTVKNDGSVEQLVASILRLIPEIKESKNKGMSGRDNA